MSRFFQKNTQFAIIGPDLRQVYLAQFLAEHGCNVKVFGLCDTVRASVCCCETLEEAITDATVILLPVPLFRKKLFRITTPFFHRDEIEQKITLTFTPEELLSVIPTNSHLFAGEIPEDFQVKAAQKNVHCHDYLKHPFVRWQNTIATTEGLIAEAILRSKRTLSNSHCLVFGCGHCGNTLLSYLNHFNCSVFVYDKDTNVLAHASLLATPVFSPTALAEAIEKSEFLFQTIPHFSLSDEHASLIQPDAVFLDITCPPCMVNDSIASPVSLPALPGRLSPYTSAKILWDYIRQEDLYGSCS